MKNKIVVLTTGGTIASVENAETGLFSSGALPGEALLGMCDLAVPVDLDVRSVFQVPSNAMSFARLMSLRAAILDVLSDERVAGIVVTHGTDTLEETAYFLRLTVGDPRPVVVTGSQRTPTELGTDSFTNIRHSILAAASPACRGMGALVVFNEGIYAARHVRKVHSFNPHAFTAFGFGQLGYVDRDDVCVRQRPVDEDVFLPAGLPPRVDIVKVALDSDGLFVDCAVDNGARGIILEGLGRGHVTPSCAPSVSRAAERGVHVVITTGCEQGRVYPVYDFVGGVMDLEARGAVRGGDHSSRKARIKLAVMLAAGVEDREAIRRAFAT
ncbi:asparaginase [Shumkonia mesophila]|uniref:asparaginase n=1 Tax=Shumkonia mesophila TaxID=2838854 RepID=UPI00293502E2|nr:asparaginase [Shumkonia mesophila]